MRATKDLREKIGFVWIVTFHAFFADIVFLGINDPHCLPPIAWIGQITMTPDTEGSAAVNREFFRIVRMTKVGAVAIFTFNHSMIGGQILFHSSTLLKR